MGKMYWELEKSNCDKEAVREWDINEIHLYFIPDFCKAKYRRFFLMQHRVPLFLLLMVIKFDFKMRLRLCYWTLDIR